MDIFQDFHYKFLYNIRMPRNKKHIFDDRDALEILRDAFLDTEPARVAELQ